MKKENGNTNRNKGHGGERHYAAVFREMGHERCVTSRYGSRMHDDAGIDLIGLPLNVQVKTGRHRAMDPARVIRYIKDRVAEIFPEGAPERDRPTLVIHRRDCAPGKARREEDDIVHLTFADFRKILEKTQEWH